ncbi:MAG: lysine--tRNA ligase [Candidatus Neomarinimicrobiota bacterium]
MKEEQTSLQQIIEHRNKKLITMKENGINPFPHKFNYSHKSKEILLNFKSLENKCVKIAGRIMAIRKMGKASFAQILDSEGRIQIFIKKDDVGENSYNNFKLLDIGDFVGVEGNIFKTKTKEISIRTDKLTVLAKSIRPLPIVKEKDGKQFDAFLDKGQRYRKRHLDLILNPDVKQTFIDRSIIIKSIRSFLDNNGFLEVETPILQPIYGGANARPFTTHHNTLNQKLFLRIADELYLKRLIIGGFDKVYELSKDFRNEGVDRSHNPEFTMLEFYLAFADYKDCMDIVEKMIFNAAKAVNSEKILFDDIEINLMESFDRKSYFDLLKNETGYDLRYYSESKLKEVCLENKISLEGNLNKGQMLDALMSNLVEPKLIKPTFIIDYPKVISPLAKEHRSIGENIVERFELFIGGSEFANSFSELNDPIEQRKRLEAQAKLRDRGDEEAQPIDEDFIQAMECGMPPTGGVGLGIDRLTMLLTGNRWIKDVILFPLLKPEK